jgi:hypothetical protein
MVKPMFNISNLRLKCCDDIFNIYKPPTWHKLSLISRVIKMLCYEDIFIITILMVNSSISRALGGYDITIKFRYEGHFGAPVDAETVLIWRPMRWVTVCESVIGDYH